MTNIIDKNVPIPSNEDEPIKKKTRGRKQAVSKTTKDTQANPASSLIAALKFISPAQKKAGPVQSQFSICAHNKAIAFDGILTIGHPIDEDLEACPNTLQFIEALSKASDELSIVQLSAETLVVSSGVFRALVPCTNPEYLLKSEPDPICAKIDDRIKTALAAVHGLATESAPNATYAAVLLQANTAVATNGACLVESWHGIDLPPGMLLPKAAAVAISKSNLPLVEFGYSNSSATFYFENGSYIKTQLYEEKYPNYLMLLNVPDLNPWALPVDFFKAIKSIEAFSPNGNLFFKEGAVFSNFSKETASTYKVEGLPEGMGFSVKALTAIEKLMKKAHFAPEQNKVYFFGEGTRGILMGLDISEPVPIDEIDDIPF